MSTEQSKSLTRYVSFMDLGDGEIIEQVGSSIASKLLIYNTKTGNVEIKESYEKAGITYLPPKGDLVANGTILLPSEPNFEYNLPDLTLTIEDFIYRYVDVSDQYRRLASYYILLSWIYDSFEVIPYLRIIGDSGTGKTRFQKVVGNLTFKPMFVGGATTASAIFRIISMFHGTLIMDEADFRFSDIRAETIKILNCGYTKGIPVLRTEGDSNNRVPTSYSVYGPKIIGTRERFDDIALESRCLTEIMSGKVRKDIPIHLPNEFDFEAQHLRNMLLGFRLQNYGKTTVNLSLAIPNIEPRVNQIILPILSIIKDENVLEEIKEYTITYANTLKTRRSDEIPAQILKVMIGMIKEGKLLKPKEIAIRINYNRHKEQGENPISPITIGNINSSMFNFPTRKVKGTVEILWNADKAKILCERYGIDFDEYFKPVDKVDDVDKSTGIKE